MKLINEINPSFCLFGYLFCFCYLCIHFSKILRNTHKIKYSNVCTNTIGRGKPQILWEQVRHGRQVVSGTLFNDKTQHAPCKAAWEHRCIISGRICSFTMLRCGKGTRQNKRSQVHDPWKMNIVNQSFQVSGHMAKQRGDSVLPMSEGRAS